MTNRERSFAVLLALFDLSRAGLSCCQDRIAGRLAMPTDAVEASLERLRGAGLVSGSRLTLTGLALASSLDRAHCTVAISTSLAA